MNTNTKFLGILMLFAILSCESDPDSNLNDNDAIRAIGASQDTIDKEKWGDFNFVLELEKPVFEVGEAISVLTYFSNIGSKTITLDGILPYRQSANPPTIEVQLNDSVIFRTSKLLDNLNNEDVIIVEPSKSVELNKFNLLNVEGQLMIWDKENNVYNGVETNSVGASLSKGSFKIHSFFHPTPQVYWSNTDTITFMIK